MKKIVFLLFGLAIAALALLEFPLNKATNRKTEAGNKSITKLTVQIQRSCLLEYGGEVLYDKRCKQQCLDICKEYTGEECVHFLDAGRECLKIHPAPKPLPKKYRGIAMYQTWCLDTYPEMVTRCTIGTSLSDQTTHYSPVKETIACRITCKYKQ